MSLFRPAQFKNRHSKNVSPLRYAIRKSGRSQTRCCIQIIADPVLLSKCGIKPDEGIRLGFDDAGKLGQLIAIEREQRSFRRTTSRQSLIASFPWNGDIERYFPRSSDPDTDIVQLVVSDASKTNGLIFELPARS
jgi:hypothetical protein